MKHLTLAFLFIVLSTSNAKAEHEIGLSFGMQHTNDPVYGIEFRDKLSFTYRYIKKRNSIWFKANNSIAKTTQTLRYGGWNFPNVYYKTVTLKTNISTIGVGFGYDLLHKEKNKICLGAEIGVATIV